MRLLVVILCFSLSGSAALVYEVVWTRQLALVFGTSEPALAILLAAFMAGLGLGALVANRHLSRIADGVRAYAWLELGVAVAALLVPSAIRGLLFVQGALFGGSDELTSAGTLAPLLFQSIAVFAVLLAPTTMMGATLPILVRAVVSEDRHLGSRVGALYASNALGAVFGALAAAFWLLPALGLRGAGYVGVGLNLFVALLALLLSRAGAATRGPTRPPIRARDRAASIIGPLMAGSGAVALGYEIIWTRLLVHVVGSTVQAFASMLACFLLGLAMGALAGTRYACTREQALRAWAWAQCWAAGLSVAAFAAIDALPRFALARASEPDETLLVSTLLAACLVVPGIVALGTTFPLAVRVAAPSEAEAGHASARVYGWNTAGALIGSVATGFVLLPALGFAGATLVCGFGGLVLALVAALHAEARRRDVLAAACALAVALSAFAPAAPMQLLRTSPFDLRAGLATVVGQAEVVHVAAGRGATVLMLAREAGFELRTNGLPEAAIRRSGFPLVDDAPQWLVSLPMLARPAARQMLVIGLGGGSLVEAIPPAIERIEVIELETEVLEANRAVARARAVDPLTDPRLRVVLNDARGALSTTTKRWDLIVSQPSHPWTAGASHLFTRDFFALVAARLEAGGVFAQWMGLDFVDESLTRTLVASLGGAFAQVEVYWLPSARAVVCLASDAPIAMAAGAGATFSRAPERYAHLGVYAPEEVIAHRVLDAPGATRFARGAEISTDDRNLFQMRARQATALDRQRADALFAREDPLRVADLALDPHRLARRLLARGARERVARLRDGWPDAGVRAALDGLIGLAEHTPERARGAFERALGSAPASLEARVGLARAAGFESEVSTTAADAGLAAAARAIGAARQGRWRAVAGAETALAKIAPSSPLFADALRLRAGWRVALRDTSTAREALALVDRLLPIEHRQEDRVLRARALALAGEGELALASLSELVRQLAVSDRGLLDAIVLALSEIEESERLERKRSALAVMVAARLEALAG